MFYKLHIYFFSFDSIFCNEDKLTGKGYLEKVLAQSRSYPSSYYFKIIKIKLY